VVFRDVRDVRSSWGGKFYGGLDYMYVEVAAPKVRGFIAANRD